MRTLNCSHCGKEFKNSRDEHLDHDHETGLFRAIDCCKCNANDTYIKYPDGYNRKENRKQWCKQNKYMLTEYHKNYKKIYTEKNKEKIAKNNIKYNEKNKEKFYKKYDCGCGD